MSASMVVEGHAPGGRRRRRLRLIASDRLHLLLHLLCRFVHRSGAVVYRGTPLRTERVCARCRVAVRIEEA